MNLIIIPITKNNIAQCRSEASLCPSPRRMGYLFLVSALPITIIICPLDFIIIVIGIIQPLRGCLCSNSILY
jgi:hypothetical protein